MRLYHFQFYNLWILDYYLEVIKVLNFPRFWEMMH